MGSVSVSNKVLSTAPPESTTRISAERSKMNCGMKCIQCFVFVFNLLIAISGLLIIAAGVLMQLGLLSRVLQDINILDGPGDSSMISELQGNQAITLPVIILGGATFVIAFLGCCGSILLSRFMIITFAILLLIVLLFEVSGSSFYYIAARNATHTYVQDFYSENFPNYWTNDTARVIIDNIQTKLECCGLTSSADYGDIDSSGTIPRSCYKNERSVFESGCLEALSLFLTFVETIALVLLVGIGAVEILGAILAFVLAIEIKTDEDRIRV